MFLMKKTILLAIPQSQFNQCKKKKKRYSNIPRNSMHIETGQKHITHMCPHNPEGKNTDIDHLRSRI